MEEYVLSSDEVLLYEGTVIRNEQEDVNMKLTTVALVFSWDVTTGRFRKKVTEHFVNINGGYIVDDMAFRSFVVKIE